MTRQSRPIVGFVATRGDAVAMIESCKTQSGGYELTSRGLRPDYYYRCGDIKKVTIFLMDIYNTMKGEGWVLTPIRALE